jgi:1-acyl-sn-glycerol-3-phosphate acyltransferase
MNYAYWRSNRVFEAWRSYFGLRIYIGEDTTIKNTESSKRRVLYTFVPHGLFPFGLILVSGIVLQNKDVRIGIASNMFYIPVFGFILRMLGCVEATKELFKKEGENIIVLIPDGIAGALYSSRKEEVLYLRSRRGFMREAIKHGFDAIVPVYCFGHTQLYDVYGWQELSRRFKFAFVAFWGRSPAIWLPHARTVSVVFGKPFDIDSKESSLDSLDRVCFEYQKTIKGLYDRYRYIVPEWDKKKELKIV